MPTPEGHAILSPSGFDRWGNCTLSAVLAQQYPQTTSEYAEAGRVAHAIAELKARKYFVEPMGARSYNAALKRLKADPHYDSGMDEATDSYLDALKEIALSFPAKPFVALETRVTLDDIIPGGFGTADCIMIGGDTVHVIDYKNGSGVPVEAEHNGQMMLYAWGALTVYAPIYGDTIQNVRMTIVQPHAGGVKSWGLSRQELTQWAINEVKPKAALAAVGAGEYRAGEWCRFCPAKAQCRARAEYMLSLEPEKDKLPPLLSDDEVGGVLSRAMELDAWVSALKDYALTAALSGATITGFKVVEGRKSRDWAGGTDAAFAELVLRGADEAILYERKPVSVAGLEKALGKTAFGELAGDLVAVRPGKPALAPETDKRPAYNAAAMAFERVDGDG